MSLILFTSLLFVTSVLAGLLGSLTGLGIIFRSPVRFDAVDAAGIGEIEKEKYIYYHCTGQHGKCPEKYARQEQIESQFRDAVCRIVLPEPFVKWATDALRLANEDDACLREDAIARLTVESERIKKRLDGC